MAEPATIVIAIIVTVLLVTMIVLLLSDSDSPNNTPNYNTGLPPVQTVEYASGYQDMVSCQQSDSRYWDPRANGGSCLCKTGYWGPDCQYQKHSKLYLAAGQPSDGVTVTTLSTQQGQLNSCLEACQQNGSCNGVAWASGNCALLTGQVIVPAGQSLIHDPKSQSVIYLKHSQRDQVLHSNQVHLFAGQLPAGRWWQLPDSNTNMTVTVGQTKTLRFRPQTIINPGLPIQYSFKGQPVTNLQQAKFPLQILVK